MNNQFAKRIADLRREKRLSQKEFGELLGVSNKAVSKWENGEALPQMKTIIKMAEVFEINPSELLTGTRYDTTNVSDQNAEFDRAHTERLEKENKQLLEQLNGARESKQHTILLFICACAICAVIAILLCLAHPPNEDKMNDDISFIGSENSYVEYGGEVFYPASNIEKAVYSGDLKEEKKYATIYDKDKNGKEVVIYCHWCKDYIAVPKDGKKFIYVCNNGKITMNEKSVSSIEIYDSKTFTEAEKKVQNGEYESLSECLLYEYYISTYLDFDDLTKFLQLYNKKQEPDNAKDLTKKYLDKKSYIVIAYINGYCYKLGILFKDDEGNRYLYCFENSKVYSFGKELNDIV